jgi:hypothetical protein
MLPDSGGREMLMMDCVSRPALFGLMAAAALAATPACAIELTPGNWQDTETGLEDGKQVAAQVTTDCMSAAEAKDPIKVLTAMKDTAGECTKFDVKQTGDVVSLVMQCGDPKQVWMDMQATYTFISPKHYSGTLKSTVILAGKKTTADKKVDSIWVGTCRK